MSWKRALGLVSALPFVLGGCAQHVTMQTVKSPVLERRSPVNASEPLLRGEWQFQNGRIVGRVAWGSCVSERSWSVEEQRITHVRPLPAAGWLMTGAGLAGIIAGLATRNTRETQTCTDIFSMRSDVSSGYTSCTSNAPDNTASNAGVLAAAVVMVTGIALLAVPPSDTTEVQKRVPHSETSTLPCITSQDLSLMSLVLKLGPRRFAHVSVGADGEASVDLPVDAHLPKGADLEILVYRAPPVFAKSLPRWTSVGRVHVLD